MSIELVKGAFYAVKNSEYNSILQVQVLDIEPWSYDSLNNIIPGMEGREDGPHVLVFHEYDQTTLAYADEFMSTWDEFAALDRWLRAERDWNEGKFAHHVESTKPAIREVLALAGLNVKSIDWRDTFKELTIRFEA